MSAPDPEERTTTRTGKEARQGEIVLRSQRRRLIFAAGLAGILVLLLVVMLA